MMETASFERDAPKGRPALSVSDAPLAINLRRNVSLARIHARIANGIARWDSRLASANCAIRAFAEVSEDTRITRAMT